MSLAKNETPMRPPLPATPLWSENFALAGFDPKSGIGLWLHLGRWRKDIKIWRELVVLMLPDGTVAVHRGFGDLLASESGPGGGNLAFRVIEPQRKLAYYFSGAVRRVTPAELAADVLKDGMRERLTFDLQYDSSLPLWDLSKAGDTQDFMGRGHIEQIGRLSGAIKIGGEHYDFDAMVNRDHSMGPRETSAIWTHQWSSGWFENDVGYVLYDAVMRGQTEPVFSEAAVYDGDRLYEARPVLASRIEDPADLDKTYSFSLEYERGTIQIQTTRIVNLAYISYTAPYEMYIGVNPHPSGKRSQMFTEQSAYATLNDHVNGHIHIERSVPGEVFIDP